MRQKTGMSLSNTQCLSSLQAGGQKYKSCLISTGPLSIFISPLPPYADLAPAFNSSCCSELFKIRTFLPEPFEWLLGQIPERDPEMQNNVETRGKPADSYLLSRVFGPGKTITVHYQRAKKLW